jgi:HIRAN domain.
MNNRKDERWTTIEENAEDKTMKENFETFGKEIYITIAGMQFRYGADFLERGMEVTLEKDPKNEYDKEAIKVSLPGLGQIGWVANSVNTVMGDCYSAGRLYDKIDDTATAVVAYVLKEARKAVCRVVLQDTEDVR